jgi:hypothetical protein
MIDSLDSMVKSGCDQSLYVGEVNPRLPLSFMIVELGQSL